MIFQSIAPYSQFGSQFYNVAYRFGFYDVILPFVLIFTVIYSIMATQKILGENKRTQMVIALALALLFLYPHFAGIQPDPVAIINSAIPNLTVLAIAIVMFIILLGLINMKFGGILQSLAVFGAIFAVGYFFVLAAGYKPFEWLYIYFPFLLDQQMQDLIIIILVFGLIVWFVVREPEASSKSWIDGFGETLKKLVGGGSS